MGFHLEVYQSILFPVVAEKLRVVDALALTYCLEILLTLWSQLDYHFWSFLSEVLYKELVSQRMELKLSKEGVLNEDRVGFASALMLYHSIL